MSREMFKESKTLKDIKDELLKHLHEESSVTIDGDGKISFYIPDNGDASWWFDDLVERVLEMAAKSNKEIINICVKNNIELFEIVKKKI